jgi:hypothetical protein
VGSGQWSVVGRLQTVEGNATRPMDLMKLFNSGTVECRAPLPAQLPTDQAATQSIRNEPVEPARSLSWRKPSTLAGVANQNWNERVIRRAVNKLPLRWVQSIC